MGCTGCGSGTSGKPGGCNSNGNCDSGGCNRLNVFNWLSDIPISDLGKPFPIVEVSFQQGSRKDFYRNNTQHWLSKGEMVAVEGSGGFDVGEVSLSGELVRWQMKKKRVSEEDSAIKKILRLAGDQDMTVYRHAKSLEGDILIRARTIVRAQDLEMKVSVVEVQADSKKITFFYTAENRVDFRELIKVFASEFKAKIEMRQIGARQESAKLGGIGSCGRELCCSTWLTNLKSVSTVAARYQNLSINQTKLSGQCGRLKCCLNFELDTYMDALKNFPEKADRLEISGGRLELQKKDIFRNLMWYSFTEGSSKQFPLTIDRVKEILVLNEKGIKPNELKAIEVRNRKISDDPESNANMGFVNDVGQITLKSLSDSGRKNKKNGKLNRPKRNRRGQGAKPANASSAEKQGKDFKKDTGGRSNNHYATQKKHKGNNSSSEKKDNSGG